MYMMNCIFLFRGSRIQYLTRMTSLKREGVKILITSSYGRTPVKYRDEGGSVRVKNMSCF